MKMYSLSKKLLLAAGTLAFATACSSNQPAPQQRSQTTSAPMPPSCGKKDDCAPCAKPQCEQKPRQECTPTKPPEKPCDPCNKPCEPCKKSCEGTETEKPSAPTASAPAAPTAQPTAPTASAPAAPSAQPVAPTVSTPAAQADKNPVSENSSAPVVAPDVSEKSVVDNSTTAPVTP